MGFDVPDTDSDLLGYSRVALDISLTLHGSVHEMPSVSKVSRNAFPAVAFWMWRTAAAELIALPSNPGAMKKLTMTLPETMLVMCTRSALTPIVAATDLENASVNSSIA